MAPACIRHARRAPRCVPAHPRLLPRCSATVHSSTYTCTSSLLTRHKGLAAQHVCGLEAAHNTGINKQKRLAWLIDPHEVRELAQGAHCIPQGGGWGKWQKQRCLPPPSACTHALEQGAIHGLVALISCCKKTKPSSPPGSHPTPHTALHALAGRVRQGHTKQARRGAVHQGKPAVWEHDM